MREMRSRRVGRPCSALVINRPVMTSESSAIASERLKRQWIAQSEAQTPEQVVRALGAIQAQDYASATWSIGLRLPGATLAAVEAAIACASIVRTWPMRGTLHMVPGEDVKWMLSLTAPRTLAARARRRVALALDQALLLRCERVLTRALAERKRLTRDEVASVLERAGVEPSGERVYHVLSDLSLRGVLCYGAHAAKQPTFVLLDAWAPKQRELTLEEALCTLATRYLASHAPATAADFAWWSGLTMRQARVGLGLAGEQLARASAQLPTSAGSRVRGVPASPRRTRATSAATARERSALRLPSYHLLPGFDEYLLGYKDRSAVLDAAHASKIVPGKNGVFRPTLLVDGRVVGTWQRELKKLCVELSFSPFARLSAAARQGLEAAAQSYGDFYALPVMFVR
jgi:hypothetical protein